MLTTLNDLNKRVWGDKIALGTTNHPLGGLGLGLLLGGTLNIDPLPTAWWHSH